MQMGDIIISARLHGFVTSQCAKMAETAKAAQVYRAQMFLGYIFVTKVAYIIALVIRGIDTRGLTY